VTDFVSDVESDTVAWWATGGSDGGTDREVFIWTEPGGVQQLTQNAVNDWAPAVSGDRVVWTRNTPSLLSALYTWTPASGVEQQIPGSEGGSSADVSSERVVWSNGDVHTWTPSGGSVQLTTMIRFSVPSVSDYAAASASGRLYASEDATAAGRPVVIQYSYDRTRWTTLKTVVTTSGGGVDYPFAVFTAGLSPKHKTYYRAHFVGAVGLPATTSGPKLVLPKVSLSRPAFRTSPSAGSRTRLAFGRTYYINGVLKPRHRTGSHQVKIRAYRFEHGAWKYKKSYTTRASKYGKYSRYTARVRLPSRGLWRVRAYHAKDSLNAKTYSSYRTVRVR
jgi:hypothetical protein